MFTVTISGINDEFNFNDIILLKLLQKCIMRTLHRVNPSATLVGSISTNETDWNC